MKTTMLKLSAEELELLTTLVADQIFRKEFIDPKIPGFKANSNDISLGKELLGRLRLIRTSASSVHEPKGASTNRLTV